VALIRRFAQFWERSDLFDVKGGRLQWNERGWPAKSTSLKGARGIYVLYKGREPVYVGVGLDGSNPIAGRLQNHARNWLAPAWDNVSWYDFGKKTPSAVIHAVESLLVANIPGLLNGAQPSRQLGRRCYPGKDKSYGPNGLWRK